ncbi:hypothetical protein [Aurantibacter crassamenti]
MISSTEAELESVFKLLRKEGKMINSLISKIKNS